MPPLQKRSGNDTRNRSQEPGPALSVHGARVRRRGRRVAAAAGAVRRRGRARGVRRRHVARLRGLGLGRLGGGACRRRLAREGDCVCAVSYFVSLGPVRLSRFGEVDVVRGIGGAGARALSRGETR